MLSNLDEMSNRYKYIQYTVLAGNLNLCVSYLLWLCQVRSSKQARRKYYSYSLSPLSTQASIDGYVCTQWQRMTTTSTSWITTRPCRELRCRVSNEMDIQSCPNFGTSNLGTLYLEMTDNNTMTINVFFMYQIWRSSILQSQRNFWA